MHAHRYATHVETILGWTGSVGATTLLFILPGAVYLRLSPAPITSMLPQLAFLITGLSIGTVSVINSAIDTFGGSGVSIGLT